MAKEGRPLKFQNVEELQASIVAYLKSCEPWTETIESEEENNDGELVRKRRTIYHPGRPLTVTGLALFLDTTRETLLDYEDRNDEFSDAIKKAKALIHNYVEEYLFTGKNIAGAIFNLKNNYGWKDKTEIEHSGKMNIGSVLNDLENGRKIIKQGVEDVEPVPDQEQAGTTADVQPESSAETLPTEPAQSEHHPKE